MRRLRSCKHYEAWRNALGALVVVAIVWGITDSNSSEDSSVLLRNLVFVAGVVVSAWLLGVRTARVKSESAARVRMEERLRLTRDVHDALSHSLGSIGVRAAVNAHVVHLSEEDLRATLLDIEADARAGIEELRKLLDRERGISAIDVLERREDPSVDKHTFQAELEQMLDAARKTGLEATLSFDSWLESLPSAYRTTLFRATRELVTNVILHASATSVHATAQRGNAGIVTTVEDDGNGRVESLAEGHGVTGIRERLALIGGQLDIADRAPRGLIVTVSVPFPREA